MFDFSLVTLCVFAVIFVLTYLLFMRKPPGIPPGWPWTFPFVGDLPLLFAGDMLVTFRKLRKKYGDIFSFYLGNDLTVVINGYDLIQKATVKHGHAFSARPKNLISNVMGAGKGIVLTDGPLWKRQRKFINSCLQEFGFGKTILEKNIMTEVNYLLEVIRDARGNSLDIKESFQASVANVVFTIVCGKRHDYNDEAFKKFLHFTDNVAQTIVENSVLLSCAPFLWYIPGDPLQMTKITKSLAPWNVFITEMYDEHKKTHDETNPRDLMDFYITEIDKADGQAEKSDFNLDQLIAVARDLFGSGSETTATALRWAILYLLKYPNIQKRLHSEIDKIIMDNRLPTLEDRNLLPYVEAFIQEVLRSANLIPLSVPHGVYTTEEGVYFEGYFIPKNTSIMFNLDSVLQDPNLFVNPTKFDPERFLDSEGNLIRPKELIPFGMGKRVCLGEAVAKMELFLFLTSLLKNFQFNGEENVEPDMKGILGLTYSPKPYKIKAVER